jgi:hypothetical protein
MLKSLIALATALLGSPAWPDTLIEHVNGIQADQNGNLQHFGGLLIGDDGKVVQLIQPGNALPKASAIVDAHGRTLLQGFIDAHGHVTELGFAALQLDHRAAAATARLCHGTP